MTSFLQTGLLHDAIQCPWSNIVAWLSRYRNPTGLRGMFVLPMAAPSRYQKPPISLKHMQNFTDFHSRRLSACSLANNGPMTSGITFPASGARPRWRKVTRRFTRVRLRWGVKWQLLVHCVCAELQRMTIETYPPTGTGSSAKNPFGHAPSFATDLPTKASKSALPLPRRSEYLADASAIDRRPSVSRVIEY